MKHALPVVPLHMGTLHPYEQLLVLLLAFGPFVVLFVVVYVVRRRDIAEEEQGEPRVVRRSRRQDDATA